MSTDDTEYMEYRWKRLWYCSTNQIRQNQKVTDGAGLNQTVLFRAEVLHKSTKIVYGCKVPKIPRFFRNPGWRIPSRDDSLVAYSPRWFQKISKQDFRNYQGMLGNCVTRSFSRLSKKWPLKLWSGSKKNKETIDVDPSSHSTWNKYFQLGRDASLYLQTPSSAVP